MFRENFQAVEANSIGEHDSAEDGLQRIDSRRCAIAETDERLASAKSRMHFGIVEHCDQLPEDLTKQRRAWPRVR